MEQACPLFCCCKDALCLQVYTEEHQTCRVILSAVVWLLFDLLLAFISEYGASLLDRWQYYNLFWVQKGTVLHAIALHSQGKCIYITN